MQTSIIFFLKLIFIVFLFLTNPSIASQNQQKSSTNQPISEIEENWREIVEAIAQHPEILRQNLARILEFIPLPCKSIKGDRELHCEPRQGITNIAIDPGPLGIIDIELSSPADCDQLYEILSNQFGKGKLEDGDKCYARWNLNRKVKKAYISVMPGTKSRSQIFLQFGIEQGP